MVASSQRKSVPPSATRYEDDVYTWVQEQIALLRSNRIADVDCANIAEELSDVGNEIRNRLESSIAVLTMHLLKWDHQPTHRSRSWALTVSEQRRSIARNLRRNPGLKGVLDEAIKVGYADGRGRALMETSLDDAALHDECPYSFDDMMNREIAFVPSPPNRRKKGRAS